MNLESSPRNRRRARRVVFWGLVCFVLGQVALLLAADSCLGVVRDPVFFTLLGQLKEQQAAAPPKRTVLLLGSSRFECGIRARLLDAQLSDELGRPVFVANWSMGGWGFFRSLLSWERLERQGVRPDLILVDVVPALLGARHPFVETTEERLPSYELDAGDAELLLRHAPWRADIHEKRWLARAAPAFGFRAGVRRLTVPWLDHGHWRSLASLREDFRWQASPARRPERVARARGEYHDRLHDFELGGCGCRALEELLGRVRASGVPAALVLMPEGPVFRSWYPETTTKQVREYLQGLSRRYGARVVDARVWLDDEGHYADSHHLTPEGATLFSRRLARQALLPMLRTLPDLHAARHR